MVDRCVCFNRLFSEMQQVMVLNKLSTYEELKKYITIAENCRLCEPFLKLMITTGKTEFEPIEINGEKE